MELSTPAITIENNVISANGASFDSVLLEDDLKFLNSKISLKTLALGVASEYCFINGFFDDAKIWEERFEKSLQANLKKLGKVKLPNRRWM